MGKKKIKEEKMKKEEDKREDKKERIILYIKYIIDALRFTLYAWREEGAGRSLAFVWESNCVIIH